MTTTVEPYAYPQPGTWQQGEQMKAQYYCASCGRAISYHSSASGSAWRHDDTTFIRCDRKAKKEQTA